MRKSRLEVELDTSFERTKNGKDEWLTPPEIIKALGVFDLDPCAPLKRPWATANRHYTIEDDGLKQQWDGRVFCNPPYGRATGLWLARMCVHGNGIALIFARTETAIFFNYIWNEAHGVMFLKGRLRFYNADGTLPVNSAGSPSCLVAYGADNVRAMRDSGLNGKLLLLQ